MLQSKLQKASVTSKPELSNLTASPLGLTTAIKHEHMLFLQSKRALKVAEWACLQLKAQLVAALGTDDAITGVITWKRSEETTTSFSSKLAKEHFPNEYLACGDAATQLGSCECARGKKIPPLRVLYF